MESEFSQKSESNYIIIKGRFKSIATNQYGLFLLTLNSMKRIENQQVIAASHADIYDLDPNTQWNKFEEFIVDRKWKGNYSNSITTSISEAFNKLPEDIKSINALYESAYNYDYDKMDVILDDIINRAIHDKNLTMETIIQEISQQELQNIKDKRSKPQKNEEDQNEKKDDSNVILKIKPVLAPLNGKPIYELRIGDRIMVSIIPASNKENYYIELNDLRDEKKGIIKPIPATVNDIKSSSSKNTPIEILTEIMPGVYGLCLEDEKLIKLKLYDPEIDSLLKAAGALKSGRSDSFSNKNGKPSKGIIIMTLFLLFIVLVFIIFILIGW
jgi:hypothetical protein